MEKLEFVKAQSDEDIRRVAVLAEEIWQEHFTDIIGEAQVNYMVEKWTTPFKQALSAQRFSRKAYKHNGPSFSHRTLP